MTDENILAIAAEISEEAHLPDFPVGKSEASLLAFYSSLSRLEKVQIHKLRHTLQKRLKKVCAAPNDVLDYISFIYAIADAKAYIDKDKKMNMRYMGVTNPSEIPDFEKAARQFAKESTYPTGPRKPTQEILQAHRRTIRAMIAEKSSLRKISAFLKDNFDVSISHTTIKRNLDFIFERWRP